MGSIPFAFSVHHFINSVGADAGFASIIGLAILILLYFAQARETASLRNHAHEAAQRIQDLEAHVAHLGRAQPQVVAAEQRQPGPAQAQVVQPGAARAAAAAAPAPARAAAVVAPVAPAGVAAPALTAATKLIPTPAPVAPAVALAPPQPPDATVIGAAPTVGPPATVAGGANGTARDQQTHAPRPVSAPVTAPPSPPPRVQIRPSGTVPPGRRPPARPQPPRQTRSFGAGRILLGVAGVLVLGGVIALLVVLTSGGGGSSQSANTQTTNAPGAKKHASRGAAVSPSSVTVSVLNGTATSGLAHRVALKLSSAGYKEGTVATATDQTRSATTIAYVPGFRRDALAVARSLKLASSSVAPIDGPTQAVACPPPTACTANVVVTVGSDLANTQ